jgi:flavin prenyltransferase
MSRRVIVGISGASGAIYGIRTLELLRTIPDVETHLILSAGARATIALETDSTANDVVALADVAHQLTNLAASISSGSFRAHGMIIAPCSVKTLSSVANCYADTLIARAADVTLKERRPLVLLFRETPLHPGQIRLMLQAAEAGAVLMPPVPAFYHQPTSIDEIVDQTVGRALDQLGIDVGVVRRWQGPAGVRRDEP